MREEGEAEGDVEEGREVEDTKEGVDVGRKVVMVNVEGAKLKLEDLAEVWTLIQLCS